MRIYEFDRFRLDPGERRLSYVGAPVALAPKALDMLIVLVENAGLLLHKEVLQKQLWPDTFVGDAALARNISDLRAALGRYSASPHIETVSKHGYRFVCQVQLVEIAEKIAPTNSDAMIAVLPFVPLDNGGAAEILGHGLAEDIIHALSRFGELKVAAYGSSSQFQGPSYDLKKVAAALGSDFIIVGSIRRLHSRFRVTAQLIETRRFTVRWSEQFERDAGDLFEIQDSIAKAIARELAPRVGGTNRETGLMRHSPQTDAWHLLWEGRLYQHRYTAKDVAHAEACFKRAIDLDPSYALAYLGIAESQHIKANLGFAYPCEVLPKAAEALSEALRLENNSGEVHAAAGVNAVFWRYDWVKAAFHFERALALSPSSSAVHHVYSLWWLRPQGRLEEAIEQNWLALALDPLSSFLRVVQAYLLYLAGRNTEAVSFCEAALSFDDKSYLGHRILGHIWQRQGKAVDANRAYETAVHLPGSSLIDLGYFAASCAMAGNLEKAVEIDNRLDGMVDEGHRSSTTMAVIQMALGRLDQAIHWIHEAINEHDPNIFGLAVDPMWVTMKDLPDYSSALSKLGLDVKIARAAGATIS